MRGILNTGITGGKITGYILGHMTLDRRVSGFFEFSFVCMWTTLLDYKNVVTEYYVRR